MPKGKRAKRRDNTDFEVFAKGGAVKPRPVKQFRKTK
jgi:hypothetical protein